MISSYSSTFYLILRILIREEEDNLLVFLSPLVLMELFIDLTIMKEEVSPAFSCLESSFPMVLVVSSVFLLPSGLVLKAKELLKGCSAGLFLSKGSVVLFKSVSNKKGLFCLKLSRSYITDLASSKRSSLPS